VRIAMAFLLVACLSPRAAHAGRTFYGWLYGTEVMPERGVELQTWVFEQNDKYASHVKETSLWWGPLVGVTDQLELSLPIEFDWTESNLEPKPTFTVRRFGIEARYRLAPSDPIQAPALVPLVRVAAKRDVSVRDSVRVEGDAVMSYEVGALHALIDVGFIGDLSSGHNHTELRPGGGVSIRAIGELRVGAEIYSEIGLEKGGDRWALVGPNVAWTHGRFWLSGAFGIGLYHVRTAPRVMWGIAF
jgi:hypothetical protein